MVILEVQKVSVKEETEIFVAGICYEFLCLWEAGGRIIRLIHIKVLKRSQSAKVAESGFYAEPLRIKPEIGYFYGVNPYKTPN